MKKAVLKKLKELFDTSNLNETDVEIQLAKMKKAYMKKNHPDCISDNKIISSEVSLVNGNWDEFVELIKKEKSIWQRRFGCRQYVVDLKNPCSVNGEITVPKGVEVIGGEACMGSNITKITIPASVKLIGINAFRNCTRLKNVIFEHGENDSITIYEGAFSRTMISEIKFPPNTTLHCKYYTYSIFDNAYDSITFSYYSSMKILGNSSSLGGVLCTLPNCSRRKNNDFDFAYKNLRNKKIILEDGIIKQSLFSDCQLAGAVLDKYQNVTVIGARAFKNAFVFKNNEKQPFEVILPNNLMEIGENAFQNCKLPAHLIIPSGLTKTGKNIFQNCQGNKIKVSCTEHQKTLLLENQAFDEDVEIVWNISE